MREPRERAHAIPRRRIAFVSALASALVATRVAEAASALDDPYDLPDAPRSMSLPELTHPDIEWTGVSTVGGITLRRESTNESQTTPAFVQTITVEVPIGLRRWFAGVKYELAGGPPPEAGGPTQLVGGNVELYGRTVWATRTGLAFGGGLGLIPALATYARNGSGADVALAAATLQPWDYPFFQPGVHTIRTFIDVRDLVGPVVIQFRQSFDWSVHASDVTDTAFAAASTLYIGYLAAPSVGVGIEATEHYLIDAPVPDNERAHFVFAPSVRFITTNVQPALSAFTSVANPLYPDAESMWGFRFALTVVWDPRRPYSPENEAR
jgi:hypothetical protein